MKFLESVRKKRRAQSISAVLEEILQATRREEEKANVARSTVEYYDSLSDEEVAEDERWGEFALRHFPKGEV